MMSNLHSAGTNTLCRKNATNNKGVMVGKTCIIGLKADCEGKIGKFELYSTETSVHFSNDKQTDSILSFHKPLPGETVKDSIKSNTVAESCKTANISSHGMTSPAVQRYCLAPYKYPSIQLRQYLSLTGTTAADRQYKPKFSKSVPDAFYKMSSLNLESRDEIIYSSSNPKDTSIILPKLGIESTPLMSFSLSQIIGPNLRKPLHISETCKFVSSNQKLQTEQTKKDLGLVSTSKNHHSENSKRAVRVKEWLNRCHSSEDVTSDENSVSGTKRVIPSKVIVDYSCDANDKCTTDSNGDKSCGSDINNSLTFSQSFTGSVKTVVEVANDVSKPHINHAGSLKPLPCVKLRQKRKDSRGRPWSVTELNQLCFQQPRFTHSNSEGALNFILFSPDNAKGVPSSKKLSQRMKRSFLTDLSVSSCTFIKANQQLMSQNVSHTSTPHSDKSNGCLSSNDETTPPAGLFPDKFSSSQKKQSSDDHSIGSCNSTSSKIKGQRSNCRLRMSESSVKHRVHSDQNSKKKKSSTAHSFKAKPTTNASCSEDRSSMSDQFLDEYQELSVHHSDLPNLTSDSDTEYLYNILVTSSTALHFVQNCMKENVLGKNFAFIS